MKEDHANCVKLDRKIGWITGKKPKEESKLMGLF